MFVCSLAVEAKQMAEEPTAEDEDEDDDEDEDE